MTHDPGFGGVDFHCHLDLYPDLQAAIAAAENAGVYTLAVTTTPKAWPRNRDLAKGTRYVRAALGLHPQLVAERSGELEEWRRYLSETKYIGEVGLDAGPRYYASFELQKHVFQQVLISCAAAGGKVLTVHSVRCASTVLRMIEDHLPATRGRVVLHWFTGSKSEARRGVELGCYFSINAEMAKSGRGRAVIASLPPDRLLTETDGPFTKTLDRAATPSDVHIASEAIASILGVSFAAIQTQIRHNLKALLTGQSSDPPSTQTVEPHGD